jgi:hypothetical protein
LCGAGGRCLPKYDWSRRLPNGGCALSSVTAPDGDLVIIGGGSAGLFVEKVSPELSLRWAHTFSSFSNEVHSVTAPAVLSDGTVVFAINGVDITFDNGTTVVTTTADIPAVLVELSSAGAYQWIKTFPQPPTSGGQIELSGVAASSGNSVTVAGSFGGQVNFDFGGAAGGNASGSGAFVCRYDEAANLLGVKTYLSSDGVALSLGVTPALAVAPDGSAYLAGQFAGTGVFGSSSAISVTYGTPFIAHIDASGSLTGTGAWVVSPTESPLLGWALANDGALFEVFGTDFRRINPTTDQPIWSYTIPGWYLARPAASTEVVVSGEFNMPTDFDLGSGQALYQPYGPAGQPELTNFLAAYDENGGLSWVREPNVGTNMPVTIGLDGALYYFNPTNAVLTDYDPGPAVDPIPPDQANCMITKFSP